MRIQSAYSHTSMLLARSSMEIISRVSVDRLFLKSCWESANNPIVCPCIWLYDRGLCPPSFCCTLKSTRLDGNLFVHFCLLFWRVLWCWRISILLILYLGWLRLEIPESILEISIWRFPWVIYVRFRRGRWLCANWDGVQVFAPLAELRWCLKLQDVAGPKSGKDTDAVNSKRKVAT